MVIGPGVWGQRNPTNNGRPASGLTLFAGQRRQLRTGPGICFPGSYWRFYVRQRDWAGRFESWPRLRFNVPECPISHNASGMEFRGVECSYPGSRLMRVVLAVLTGALFGLLPGCGGGSAPGAPAPTPPTSPVKPTITVTPSAASVTTAQALSVAVAVSGGSGSPTPTGSVTLTSGSATILVAAGSLSPGSDTLTASYTPDAASSQVYASASGAAIESVTSSSGAPTVTATSTTYATLGAPFQAAVTASGTVFVSVTDGVQVFTPTGGGLQSACVNELPSALLSEGASFANLSFFSNGAEIGGGIGSPGAIFYNVAALESCAATGYLVSQGLIGADEGTLEVAVTPDGKYAFVSNEYGVVSGASTEGNIGVVALMYDANGNVTTGTTLIGQISTGGNAVAGMTLSPDGKRLYVTSGVAAAGTPASGGNNPVLAKSDCVQQSNGSVGINGLLTVIDVAAAESAPGPAAVLATVDAGCMPVRMSESADESTLWVAVRGDNRVLAFGTAMLESNPNNALLGYADTGGTAPVGIRLFHHDELLAVANSNRFNTGMPNATILYVSTSGAAGVVQTIPTGLFPREIWVGPDDATLYLTNYDSGTLQVIETTVN